MSSCGVRTGPGRWGSTTTRRRRQRRQDRDPEYRETGGLLRVPSRPVRRGGHRFFGRTAVVEVPELTALEIDTEADLAVASALAAVVDPRPRWSTSAAVATDFDGVHTDDGCWSTSTGRGRAGVAGGTGWGSRCCATAGVPFVIVSKERNPVVGARAAKLGSMSCKGSRQGGAPAAWLDGRGLAPVRSRTWATTSTTCGDGAVGWPIAVADAHPEVLRAARLVLTRPGGRGAVREVCDLVLAARDVRHGWIRLHNGGGTASRSASTCSRPAVPGSGGTGGSAGPPRVASSWSSRSTRCCRPGVEVVGGQPRRIGGVKAARAQVGQGAQAARALRRRC